MTHMEGMNRTTDMDDEHPYNVSGFEEPWQIHPIADTPINDLGYDFTAAVEVEDGPNPPPEVIQLLNDVEHGYVGLTKPLVEFIDESQEDYLSSDIGY